MESKKIVVDHGGNKRTEVTTADLAQALLDIDQWFQTHGKAYYEKNMVSKGAPADATAMLKMLDCESSVTLGLLLQKYPNGGLHLLDTY